MRTTKRFCLLAYFVAAASLLHAGAVFAQQPVPAPAAKVDAAPIWKVWPYARALLPQARGGDLQTQSVGKTQCTKDPCEVDVTVTLVPMPDDATKFVCLAQAPNVNFAINATETSKRTLKWTLKLDALASGQKMGFHEKSGILLVDTTIAGHVSLGKADGPTDARDKFDAKVDTRFGAETLYLPVVVWYLVNSQGRLAPELCAARDPRIVNG